MKKALEDVVLFAVDAEKGEGIELAKKYQVQGYPTFIFADEAGEAMDAWSGYGKPFFLERMTDALADPTTIAAKTARFAKTPTTSDAVKLARFHGTRGAHDDAIGLYEKATKLDPEEDFTYPLFQATFAAWRDEVSSVDDVVKRAEAVYAAGRTPPAELVSVTDMMVYTGKKAERPELATPFLAPALEASAGIEALAERRAGIEVEHAVLVEKDLEKAVGLKRAMLPEGWKEDPGQLNAFAWWCFENSVNLAEAEGLARRGAELAPAGGNRANLLDTAAEICNARGNCDDAVELMQLAVENAPEKEYFQKQLERFRQIRESQAN